MTKNIINAKNLATGVIKSKITVPTAQNSYIIYIIIIVTNLFKVDKKKYIYI